MTKINNLCIEIGYDSFKNENSLDLYQESNSMSHLSTTSEGDQGIKIILIIFIFSNLIKKVKKLIKIIKIKIYMNQL